MPQTGHELEEVRKVLQLMLETVDKQVQALNDVADAQPRTCNTWVFSLKTLNKVPFCRVQFVSPLRRSNKAIHSR